VQRDEEVFPALQGAPRIIRTLGLWAIRCTISPAQHRKGWAFLRQTFGWPKSSDQGSFRISRFISSTSINCILFGFHARRNADKQDSIDELFDRRSRTIRFLSKKSSKLVKNIEMRYESRVRVGYRNSTSKVILVVRFRVVVLANTKITSAELLFSFPERCSDSSV
jgi:hypothetical protein